MATQTQTIQYEAPSYQSDAPPHSPFAHHNGEWNQNFHGSIDSPTHQLHNTTTSQSQSQSQSHPHKWHTSYCGFCSPFSLGLIACCAPCFAYGKTSHRLRWGNSFQNYDPMNPSCLIFFIAGCFGVSCIPLSMQRSDLRAKYNLEGSFTGDMCSACCCPICDVAQQEKESHYRESLRDGQGPLVNQQYASLGSMSYPAPAYHQPPAKEGHS